MNRRRASFAPSATIDPERVAGTAPEPRFARTPRSGIVPAVPSYRTLRWLTRRGISRRRLRGGIWHRLLGERLFDRTLWRMDRDSVARGWLIGALAGSFPLGGVQWLLGVPTAFVFRANLFVVAALICATNPLTIGFYYPFCFVVGCRVVGRPVADFHWENWGGLTFLDAGLPLLVGTMVVGGAIGALGYAGTYLFWHRFSRR